MDKTDSKTVDNKMSASNQFAQKRKNIENLFKNQLPNQPRPVTGKFKDVDVKEIKPLTATLVDLPAGAANPVVKEKPVIKANPEFMDKRKALQDLLLKTKKVDAPASENLAPAAVTTPTVNSKPEFLEKRKALQDLLSRSKKVEEPAAEILVPADVTTPIEVPADNSDIPPPPPPPPMNGLMPPAVSVASSVKIPAKVQVEKTVADKPVVSGNSEIPGKNMNAGFMQNRKMLQELLSRPQKVEVPVSPADTGTQTVVSEQAQTPVDALTAPPLPEVLTVAPKDFQGKKKVVESSLNEQLAIKSIEEFHKVEKQFHDDMKSIYDLTCRLPDELPVDKQLLGALLAPYRSLSENPFNKRETILKDVTEEIEFIADVMRPDNKLFNETLIALACCAASLQELNKIILDCIEDGYTSDYMKHLLGKWLLKGYFEEPNQNLMRYQLLLQNIEKYLMKVDYSEKEKQAIFPLLTKSLDYIKEKINFVEDYKEYLSDFNRLERALARLLDREIRHPADAHDPRYNSVQLLEDSLLFVILGKRHVITESLPLNNILKKLVNLLSDVIDRFTPPVNSTWTNSLYNGVSRLAFWRAGEVDPLVEIANIRDDFAKILVGVDILPAAHKAVVAQYNKFH